MTFLIHKLFCRQCTTHIHGFYWKISWIKMAIILSTKEIMYWDQNNKVIVYMIDKQLYVCKTNFLVEKYLYDDIPKLKNNRTIT